MRVLIATLLTGLVTYLAMPALNALVASLPATFTPKSLLIKCAAIFVLWLIINMIIHSMTRK